DAGKLRFGVPPQYKWSEYNKAKNLGDIGVHPIGRRVVRSQDRHRQHPERRLDNGYAKCSTEQVRGITVASKERVKMRTAQHVSSRNRLQGGRKRDSNKKRKRVSRKSARRESCDVNNGQKTQTAEKKGAERYRKGRVHSGGGHIG